MFVEDCFWVISVKPSGGGPCEPFRGVLSCFNKQTGNRVWQEVEPLASRTSADAVAAVKSRIDEFKGYAIPEIRVEV